MSKNPPEFFMEPAKQVPFWKVISDEVNQSRGWIKTINKMTISEIYHLIEKGKLPCGTCSELLDIEIPKTYDALRDIIISIINPMVLPCCDGCMLDTFDKGRVFCAVDNDKFLDEIKQIRKKYSDCQKEP